MNHQCDFYIYKNYITEHFNWLFTTSINLQSDYFTQVPFQDLAIETYAKMVQTKNGHLHMVRIHMGDGRELFFSRVYR